RRQRPDGLECDRGADHLRRVERPAPFYDQVAVASCGQLACPGLTGCVEPALVQRLIMRPARSTTILSVRRGDRVALGGDGQVTLGNVVAKHDAVKIRRIGGGKVLTGFAGSAADACS